MKLSRLILILALCAPSLATTKFRLHNTAAAISGYKAMDISLGPFGNAAIVSTTTATAGGTDIQLTDTAGGNALSWISEPFSAGFTLSGTVTCNLYGGESATSVNAAYRCRIFKYSGGSEGSAIGTCQMATELSTSTTTARNWTCTPTSTAFSAGDRLVVKFFLENCATSGCPTGTMGAGTVTSRYEGPTDATSGSSWVQINETQATNVESAGHMIVVTMSANPGTGWSVSDDGGNTYNAGPTCTNGFEIRNMFYALNVAAARKITITHSAGTVTFFSARASEWSNIPIASALDVSTANCAAAGATVTAGSITPNFSGEVLLQTNDEANTAETTAYSTATQGACAWAFLDTRLSTARASQWCNYASTSAINPTLTRNDTGLDFYSLAAGFKQSGANPSPLRWSSTGDMSNSGQSSAAGASMILFLPDPALAATTGMHMEGIQLETYQLGSTVSPQLFQFTHTGNLVVLVNYSGQNDHITAISSTPSHTWTSVHANVLSPSSNNNSIIWCSDTGNTGTETLSISATINNSPTNSDDGIAIFGVSGAKSTSCADAASHNGFATGTKTGVTPLDQSTGGVSTGSFSITPSASDSLIIGVVPVDFNTVNNVTNGQIQNCYLSTNSSGNTPYCENNGVATIQNHATTAFEFVWALQSGLGANTNEYAFSWAEFLAPAATPSMVMRHK